jgi:hypothetical protein
MGRLGVLWEEAVDDEKMRFASSAEEAALQDQAAGLLRAYMAHVPPHEKPLAVEVALEEPLVDPESREDLGIPLVGIVDLVVADSAGPLVVDFKTSSRSGGPLEIMHEIQLTCYAYLIRAALAKQESALEIRSLIKTKTPKVEFHRYATRTEVHFRRLTVVREYLDALDRGCFGYRPGFGCSMCAFRETRYRAWNGHGRVA